MANEAVPIKLPTRFSRVTLANGTGIEQFTIMKLASDPNTATATGASGDVFAGILMDEKVASDGQISGTVALDGEWDLKDSGTGITLGSMCSTGGANLIKLCTAAELLSGACIGKVLETTSASEVVRVRVGGFV